MYIIFSYRDFLYRIVSTICQRLYTHHISVVYSRYTSMAFVSSLTHADHVVLPSNLCPHAPA